MQYAVIQPRYEMAFDRVDECFAALLAQLDACTPELDVIVLPEYSDVPGNIRNKAEYEAYSAKNQPVLMEKVRQTAIRCAATVFVNAAWQCEKGLRNTTFAVNSKGEIVGRYCKAHPAPSEVRGAEAGGIGLDVGYSYEPAEPYILELDGIRYGFMTCYDFYFYEAYPRMAREQVDVIIGCSLQRTDTHNALEIIGRFLAYHTNAYLVRASVSLGEDSGVCGSSMLVAPDGTVLENMRSRVGMAVCDIDPKAKYYKAAGFGGKPSAHYEYIEVGRRPWNYRPAGSAIALPESLMPYPRVCAHRGFSKVAPENSMPAFGAAVALGAEEIGFDLWSTKDGEIVSCHDATLDRVSTGSGLIYEHTLAELQQLDFGVKFGESFQGLCVVTFEEILQKFACHTIMNIHIKPMDMEQEYPAELVEKILKLIRKYDCEQYVYFMLEPDIHIRQFKKAAPHIPVCVGHLAARPWAIVDRAIELGAEKVQLFKPYFNQEMVDKAHAHGIRCNVFWSDVEAETRQYLDMGIDTVLSNTYLHTANTVKAWKTENR